MKKSVIIVVGLLVSVLGLFSSCSDVTAINAVETEEIEKTPLNDIIVADKETAIGTGELETSIEEETKDEDKVEDVQYHISWDLEEDELRIIAQYAQSFPVSPYWRYCSNIETYTEDNTLIVNTSTIPNTLIPKIYPYTLIAVYAFNGDSRIQQRAFSAGGYSDHGVHYDGFYIPDYWKDAKKFFIIIEIEEYSIMRMCYIKIVRD